MAMPPKLAMELPAGGGIAKSGQAAEKQSEGERGTLPWEIARRDARLADIELGLSDPDDGETWRRIARERRRALLADRMDYGLMPYEQQELDAIDRLLGPEPGIEGVLAFIVGGALCIAILVACSFWMPA